MTDYAHLLRSHCAAANLQLSDRQVQLLTDYLALILKWNSAYNLTAVRDGEEMVTRHLLDSLVVAPFLADCQHIADVGTGPGLPGVPLAILYPDKQFTLIDSLGKRIVFLRQVRHLLGLPNIEPVQTRVEQYRTELTIDGVVSRAFASIGDMLKWCAHLSDRFFAMKGAYPEAELLEVKAPFKVAAVHRLTVPGQEGERHLVEITKQV